MIAAAHRTLLLPLWQQFAVIDFAAISAGHDLIYEMVYGC
jgi:hypothetical protein